MVGPLAEPPQRPHPVELDVTDDLRRSRVTVFFRPLFLYPHLIWSVVWSNAAFVAAVANWILTLILGRSPQALEDFLSTTPATGRRSLPMGS